MTEAAAKYVFRLLPQLVARTRLVGNVNAFGGLLYSIVVHGMPTLTVSLLNENSFKMKSDIFASFFSPIGAEIVSICVIRGYEY